MDANAPELDQETRQNLVLWVIDNNDPRLLDYCQTIMKRFTQQQMMHLALGILDSASRGSEMTGVECGVVSEVLQGLLNARQVLAESQYLLFDQNIPKFDTTLKNTMFLTCTRSVFPPSEA